MYYVYVILNEQSGKINIGYTGNLEKRLRQHNDSSFTLFGRNSYTKANKGKWILKYNEQFIIKKEALKREKELKSSRGRNYIKTNFLGLVAQR